MNRREFNKQETIKHIQAVFISDYIKVGIDQITVNELCKKAGISKSTFYTYYNDKYEVLDLIEERLLLGLEEIAGDYSVALSEVSKGIPSPIVLRTIDFVCENSEAFRAMLGVRSGNRFRYKWKRIIERDFLRRYTKEKGDPQAANIACMIFSASVIELYTHFLFDNKQITKQEFAIIIGNLTKFVLYDFNAFIK